MTPATTTMDADVVLAGLAAGTPPIGLEDVPELMSRVDHKYIVTAETMVLLAAELRDRFAVLSIDGRRQFRYSSTYFDTPDLLTYEQHRQNRRRRFKLRTRTYVDSGGRWLELKLNGTRGSTDKHRIPYDDAPAHALTGPALDFVSDTLVSELHLTAPDPLGPVLSTDYRRVTLVDRSGTARLTCDTGLICRNTALNHRNDDPNRPDTGPSHRDGSSLNPGNPGPGRRDGSLDPGNPGPGRPDGRPDYGNQGPGSGDGGVDHGDTGGDGGMDRRNDDRRVAARRDLVLLESKSTDGRAVVDRVLRGLGARPVTVSKYCLAVAALHRRRANRWRPVLQHYLEPEPQTFEARRPPPIFW
ncbi:polyphosphate polymerase domain-containing protein [Actinomadura sp. ATCC 31491]|uniref:Polyphosphate polymerase domain-containing protein n=1 Tax=Actinomadura luzonensis TaxID=2805427 RepID=A0ABT0GB99_9ACTN|nr:polyphosphate polymerase domain-containing protein [Actinomadura luzonensis]MCK2221888.1 polyphosphate polymerase domain-containing protein [Actinomadura luzonensis]